MTDYTVSSGVTSSGLTISSIDTLTVEGGGVARRIKLHGGLETVDAGGEAIRTTVTQFGEQDVYGLATSTTLVKGYQAVFGTADHTVLTNAYAEQDVLGTASDTTILAGEQYVVGGVAIDTTVSGQADAAGYQFILSGGLTSDATIDDNGRAIVSSGGSARSVTVEDGGYFSVRPYATASGVTVSSGGVLAVWNDDTLQGVHIRSGGRVIHNDEVFSGSTLSDFTVVNSGAVIVDPGGVLAGATVKPGGEVLDYGSASGMVISSIASPVGSSVGQAVVYSGATASGTLIRRGYEGVFGGVDTGAVVKGLYEWSGTPSSANQGPLVGDLGVHDGGVASGAVVYCGGVLEADEDGVAAEATVRSGGVLELMYLGSAVSATVMSGGDLLVYSRGRAQGTFLEAGAMVDFGDVSATCASVVSHHLIAYSGGVEVASIGLRGATADLGFVSSADGNGGTAFLVTSAGQAMTSAMATFAPENAMLGRASATELQSARFDLAETLGPREPRPV